MRTSSTDQNPDVIRLNSEIQSLRNQLRAYGERAERGLPGVICSPAGAGWGSARNLRKQRDVQYHTLIFDLIARQFEAARLDEAKASPVIQVLDPAEAPDRNRDRTGRCGP